MIAVRAHTGISRRRSHAEEQKVLFFSPVVILKRLIPQKQVPEAVSGWERRHLGVHICHLQSGDVQDHT